MPAPTSARLRRRAPLVAALIAGLVSSTLAGGPALAAHDTSEIVPIGHVQGVVDDDADGFRHRSAYAPPSGRDAGRTVTVQGVITQRTLARTNRGFTDRGFFLQNTAATADGDERTSDGIFVYHRGFTTLLREGGGFYTPRVGDEVVLRGPVVEFFDLTQLGNPRLVSVVRTGVVLDVEVPAFEADPPNDLGDAYRYWERREGMRARVPAGSVVVGGRNVFPSTAEGEVWVIRGDHPVAQRTDAYARRVFRDAHPLDNVPDRLFDDGNGYRIMMASLGLKAASGDNRTLITPARTYDTMTNAPVGGVYFGFGKYGIQVGTQPALVPGFDPALNAPPRSYDREREYSSATYNVENLYDYRDDPFDGCDFADDPGCIGVSPPFDYVPTSDAEYRERLGLIARQIVDDLHSPELVLVQEAEDQDICTVSAATLECGTTNDRDGRPDTLQELTLAIAAAGGPPYESAYDRDGADDRGIVSAFLYRTDRVELLPADPSDPVLGSDPDVEYRGAPLAYNTEVENPKVLNADLPADVDTSTGTDGELVYTRPPQIGLFRVWRDGIGTSTFTDLYASSNHFSSTPDRRVGQRTEQAAYLAAIVHALENVDPDVIVGGDFNVYPRPDDPFPSASSDQLGPLYDSGLGSLFDVLVREVPAAAYSYVFQGQTQTLDQQFVTESLFAELVTYRVAHVNADWPAEYPGDGPRGLSDHDPSAARLSALPTIDRLADLVRYYAATGRITEESTTRQLLDRLDRAARFDTDAQDQAADAQLRTFIRHVEARSPRTIDGVATEALRTETELLLANRW